MKRRVFLAQSFGLTASAAFFAFTGVTARSIASVAHGHRIIDLDLIDTERGRAVPSRLYVPHPTSLSSAVPLVVFSHGLGGSRLGYSYLGGYLADAGIASLHPQHIGSDNALWRGNPLELLQRLRSAAGDSEAHARALDIRFVLDEVLSSNSGPLLFDTSRIAVAGHSYGANTAMLVSGARVKAAEMHVGDLRDKRIRAAILISAPPFVGQGPMEKVLNAVSIPTLHITSVNDTINLPGYRSTVEDRLTIFHAMSESPRALAVFNTGGHSIFTDRTTFSGPEISNRVKNATRELCALFLIRSLSENGQIANEQSFLFPDISERTQEVNQWLSLHNDLLDKFVIADTSASPS